MITQTPAFVLSSLRYGESSLIIQTYTLSSGVKSFIKKGAWGTKKKKSIPYFPLTELLLTYDNHNKNKLTSIKEAQLIHYQHSIYQNTYKNSMVFFLAEVLKNALQEEEPNSNLYHFIKNSLEVLEHSEVDFSNLHLWFLFELTRYLGFYPSQSNSHFMYFDLDNGVFSSSVSSSYIIKGEELKLFKLLFNNNLRDLDGILFNRNQRQQLLDILIQYYELHIADFRRPKSLEVLRQLFS